MLQDFVYLDSYVMHFLYILLTSCLENVRWKWTLWDVGNYNSIQLSISIVCLVRFLSALCSVVCVRVSSSSAAAVASCCNSSESLQSDWGRFLYDHKSLCEHITTADTVKTLTVINCCIFNLNSTDGQSEVRAASTATKPSWCVWMACAHISY